MCLLAVFHSLFASSSVTDRRHYSFYRDVNGVKFLSCFKAFFYQNMQGKRVSYVSILVCIKYNDSYLGNCEHRSVDKGMKEVILSIIRFSCKSISVVIGTMLRCSADDCFFIVSLHHEHMLHGRLFCYRVMLVILPVLPYWCAIMSVRSAQLDYASNR